jgi:hypothetical protein
MPLTIRSDQDFCFDQPFGAAVGAAPVRAAVTAVGGVL